MSVPSTKITICVLLVACAAILGYALRQNYLWKQAVSGLAASEGVARAQGDFRAGKLQLFVLVDERSGDSFRGSNDGPFKVSAFSSHPFDYPSRYSAAQVVASYNRRMRALHDHPERYVAMTNAEGRIEWK